MAEILGLKSDVVYAMIIILILIVLGVVSFHYYAFVSAGQNSALSMGAGTSFVLLPNKKE
jgi:hypothetical protein